MPYHLLRRVTLLAVALVPIACVDMTGLGELFGGHLTGISVDNGAIVEVGDTVRLSARGAVDGLLGLFSYDRLLDASWTISDPTIARLELLEPPLPPPQDSSTPTRTLVRGRRPGTVTVKASARGVSGEAPVRVIPVIATIQVLTFRDTLAVGDTIEVRTAVVDAGGGTIGDVPLTFEAGGGVQLAGYNASTARVVATTVGTATISARFRRATGIATLVVVSPSP